MTLRRVVTPSREEWLKFLYYDGPQTRDGFRRAPCDCMRLGWTEWIKDSEGNITNYEKITKLGIEALDSIY